MSYHFENELNKFYSERLKKKERNGSLTNDEQTKWKKV